MSADVIFPSKQDKTRCQDRKPPIAENAAGEQKKSPAVARGSLLWEARGISGG